MKPALALSYGFPDGAMATLASHPDAVGRITVHDLYGLPALDLNQLRRIADQHAQRSALSRNARAHRSRTIWQQGGTVVANGHFAYPFLPRMTGFHAIDDYNIEDIAVRRLVDHPIWAGVSENDLTFRRGVAGFYGRAWHEPPRARPLFMLWARPTGRSISSIPSAVDACCFTAATICGSTAVPIPPAGSCRNCCTGCFPGRSPHEPGYPRRRLILSPRDDLRRALSRAFDRTIYMPELTPAHLEGIKLLIVPDRINPDFLRSRRQILIDFAERGGTLVVLGENQAETWLPGVNWTSRPTNFWWWLEKDAKPEQRLVCPDMSFFRRCRSPIPSGISTAF